MPPEIAKYIKDFRQEMREMRSSLEKELRKEFKELKLSIDFFSQQFDAMATRCSQIEKENSALKKENATLTSRCASLMQRAHSSEERITNLEQYSRNKNIELKGIPPTEDESVIDLVKKIGQACEEEINENDIEICHRVPRKDKGCPNIVVQFKARAKRDAILAKARKKEIVTSDLSLSGESPIYVNEHLCPALKKLLGMTVAKKKENNWKYAWVKDGKILARKTDTSNVLRVTCPEDLDKMQ